MSTSQIALLASVQQFLDRQHGLYIDGAPCAAQSENRLTVWDPATGQAIATTADASPADVDRAVMSAWRAFVDRRWAGRTPADRERILLRFADLVQQALAGTRCAVDLAADFTTVAWRKLLQNAVAGLMVLTGRRAGMFAREDITALGLAYLRECLQVARAEGAALSDNVPVEIIAGFHRAPADLSTSILIDRLNGRPLEWDIRNGVVQRRGRQHGIPTPLSDIIVPLLAAASDGPG